jgi:hypothetical protein
MTAVLAGIAALAGVGATAPARNLYCSAHEVVEYYRALEESELPAGFLERLTLSMTLARAQAGEPGRACERN